MEGTGGGGGEGETAIDGGKGGDVDSDWRDGAYWFQVPES